MFHRCSWFLGEKKMGTEQNSVSDILEDNTYKFGFTTDVESETFAKGLDEDVVRAISKKKEEPQFMLDFRLKAFAKWKTMKAPKWPNVQYPPIDFQDISYYSAPKKKKVLQSLDEVDPEVMRTFEKLGIPLDEQKKLANVAVDAVFDSVSVATTHKKKLMEVGIIFCPMSEALKEYPELVEQYLGTVVPVGDNFYSALNSAVFTDGSFVYIPPDTISPMEISTYFRINTEETGQFERTLIICAENSYVSYLEGCTAPQFDTNQLHAAVVELITLENAEIKYSTVQNWYAGDKETGKGGVFNFVTKRGKCQGNNSKISWTQVETGSAITWKYPSCILQGDNTTGEFYSVALTNGHMQADTGTKMIHIGKNTRSSIISKGISADYASNTYRGQVKVGKNATNARNYSQCDSMLVGDKSSAHTFPYIETANSSVQIEHEASTSKISEEQLFYFESRGISRENAIEAVISGFCKEVFKQLPMEFAVEAQKLLTLKLEDSVG